MTLKENGAPPIPRHNGLLWDHYYAQEPESTMEQFVTLCLSKVNIKYNLIGHTVRHVTTAPYTNYSVSRINRNPCFWNMLLVYGGMFLKTVVVCHVYYASCYGVSFGVIMWL